MIPLYLPYYASTNAAAISGALQHHSLQAVEDELRAYFRQQYGFAQVFFTKSCTHALETIALLLGLNPGDEVIVPSYAYVSTANAFALHGAGIVFADSNGDHPNVDVQYILQSITPKTRAVVVMHYGGVEVKDLDLLRHHCDEKGIFLIEDAAHCLNAFGQDKSLGSTGHAATFSFHESKNLGCVEGGLLVITHAPWLKRVEAILNKGTNRAMFERKETAVYEWVDTGSAFRMDLVHMSLLRDQLRYTREITDHRLSLYRFYLEQLMAFKENGWFDFYLPDATQQHNAHIFWIILHSNAEREALRKHLLEKNIYSTFHYLALHNSPYGKRFSSGKKLPHAEKFENCLLRIPLYYPMPLSDAATVVEAIRGFFG